MTHPNLWQWNLGNVYQNLRSAMACNIDRPQTCIKAHSGDHVCHRNYMINICKIKAKARLTGLVGASGETDSLTNGWCVILGCVYKWTKKDMFHARIFCMFTCSLQFLLKSKPQASNPSLEAQITASKLKSQPHGSNHSLKHQITAMRLK